MSRWVSFWRLLQIQKVIFQQAFVPSLVTRGPKALRYLSRCNPYRLKQSQKNRGEILRETLESLGPIYVKFGQALSTRMDLLSPDIIVELEKLQDQVPPFDGQLAKKMLEKAYQKPLEAIFKTFDLTPLAAASIAQVHAATLSDGSDVVVKILRPNMLKMIRKDIAALYTIAKLLERFWLSGKRLRPVELVQEFEQTILDELDLTKEAANASLLRRNFQDSPMMYVPKIYWDYIKHNVLVMERIYGVQISNVEALKAANVSLKKLAEYGVEIFFTQVFRDSFFHADMHPGNLFVDVSLPENPRYLGVDFGIMGTLSPNDQLYLAKNLLAFFHRDYKEVAALHIECGWVPANTRVDQFESAIRTVCEPIFEKPLSEISFGQLLLNLFRTAKRFNMEIQPQLMLLQKTLFNIEGLGRKLYPELDLWQTAKPFMERWMREQMGAKHTLKSLKKQLPELLDELIESPALWMKWLRQQTAVGPLGEEKSTPSNSFLKGFLSGVGVALLIMGISTVLMQFMQ